VTGWNTSAWELMKVGERVMNMARLFNVREGFGRKDDWLPERFFEPFASGRLAGVAIDRDQLDRALTTYYEMMGWDAAEGHPHPWKLAELGIEALGRR
jgi:aldehyde:ferredoxin oxidoreductase